MGNFVCGAHWALAAPTQSTPEAELVALTEGVRNAGLRADFVFDCLGLMKGLKAGKRWCTSTKNKFACRWRALWHLLDDRSWAPWTEGPRPDVELTFRWMPAHTAKRAVDEGLITLEDWNGNREADRLAKAGANEHRVPDEICDGIRNLEEATAQVLNWVAAIPTHMKHYNQWHDVHTCPPPPKVPKTDRPKLGPRKPAEGGHEWKYVHDDHRWRCEGCAARTTTPTARQRQRCTGAPIAEGEPGWIRVIGVTAEYAGPGHNLVRHGRLVWCSRCAHYSTQPERIRELAAQCRRYCPPSHSTIKSRILKGEFPVRGRGKPIELLEGKPRRLGDVGKWRAPASRAKPPGAKDNSPEPSESPHWLRAKRVADEIGGGNCAVKAMLREIGIILEANPERANVRRKKRTAREAGNASSGNAKKVRPIYYGGAAAEGREPVCIYGGVLADGKPIDPELRGIAVRRAGQLLPGGKPKKAKTAIQLDDDESSVEVMAVVDAAESRADGGADGARDAPQEDDARRVRRRVTWGPDEVFLI